MMHTGIDYARNPMLVYWETTQACPLACKHCRASAMPHPHPDELNHEEAKRLLDQIAAFDVAPHLVFTGGDPLRRADIWDLIAYSRSLDIRVSITPAASPELTRDRILQIKDAGIESMALSLDGSNATRHDTIRQVNGCFDTTMQAATWAGEAGIPLQINTLVSEETADDLPAIYELLHKFPVMRWSMFFLISVGRGMQLNEVSPERGEEIMRWGLSLVRRSPFLVATTEAPSYRRVAHEMMVEAGMTPEQMNQSSVRRGHGIRDGNGVMFVSHLGEVFPSGFLPALAGSVKEQNLLDIYRDSAVFRTVRDTDAYTGKCGICEFKKICGGSRARAFAYTGELGGSDPLCPYVPAA